MFIGTVDGPPDYQTVAYCKQDAIHEIDLNKNTEFEHFDFYKSCIENLTRTSPITQENKWNQLLNRR